MYRFTLILMTLLICFMAVQAEETSCPAVRASDHGFSAFEKFHHVMAPAWHSDWADKNYEALFAVGPDFQESFKAVAAIIPDFKKESRNKDFNEKRATLGKIIEEYTVAAKAKDSAKVYALMPDVHDAFEMAASSLLPISFPAFDNLVITANLIIENHLPSENMEGIIGSTETLTLKINNISEKDIPEELIDQKDEVLKSLTEIKATIAEMQKCCNDKDMTGYKKHNFKLQAQLTKFIETYI